MFSNSSFSEFYFYNKIAMVVHYDNIAVDQFVVVEPAVMTVIVVDS